MARYRLYMYIIYIPLVYYHSKYILIQASLGLPPAGERENVQLTICQGQKNHIYILMLLYHGIILYVCHIHYNLQSFMQAIL